MEKAYVHETTKRFINDLADVLQFAIKIEEEDFFDVLNRTIKNCNSNFYLDESIGLIDSDVTIKDNEIIVSFFLGNESERVGFTLNKDHEFDFYSWESFHIEW